MCVVLGDHNSYPACQWCLTFSPVLSQNHALNSTEIHHPHPHRAPERLVWRAALRNEWSLFFFFFFLQPVIETADTSTSRPPREYHLSEVPGAVRDLVRKSPCHTVTLQNTADSHGKQLASKRAAKRMVSSHEKSVLSGHL